MSSLARRHHLVGRNRSPDEGAEQFVGGRRHEPLGSGVLGMCVRTFDGLQGPRTVAEPESERAHDRPPLGQAEVIARGDERRHVALDLHQGRPHRELRVEVVRHQGALDGDARDDRVGARIGRSDGRSLEELDRSFELTSVVERLSEGRHRRQRAGVVGGEQRPSPGPGAVRLPRSRHVPTHALRPRAGAHPRGRRSRVRRRRRDRALPGTGTTARGDTPRTRPAPRRTAPRARANPRTLRATLRGAPSASRRTRHPGPADAGTDTRLLRRGRHGPGGSGPSAGGP